MSNDDNTIICRCSDLTVKQIREMIQSGVTSIDEIKRLTRMGMGPCQGRNCVPLALREIANITGTPITELSPGAYRPPVKAVTLGEVLDGIKAEKEGKGGVN